ncbi:MAG: SPOR domain-containing protein [Rhodospirillaceae bacterium]|nr:SPOR domain-containing protein [Rhodospirillaceae bacterium]
MAIDRDGDGPPLRKDEAKPEASGELRATPFTEDVFDDEYYNRRGSKAAGSPFGLILGVIVGAALAGGGAWFVLNEQNVGGLDSSGGVPVVKADSQPYKIKPDNPGGMQVENQDKTVYDRVAKTDAPQRVENLLPPAELPKTPPKIETPKAEAPKAEPAPPVKSPLDEKRDELAAMIANLDKKTEAQEKWTSDAIKALADPAKPAAVPAPKPAAPVAAPEASKESVPPPPEVATPQVAAIPPQPVLPSAGVLVQLAAAKTEEAAMAEWNRVKNRHAELLGGLSPTVVRADLGERGVFFRLRAGTLPDKAAADALCTALTAQGAACLVVKP